LLIDSGGRAASEANEAVKAPAGVYVDLTDEHHSLGTVGTLGVSGVLDPSGESADPSDILIDPARVLERVREWSAQHELVRVPG
jgi:hypothetical protein